MSAKSSDTTNSVDAMAQGGANKICSVCGDKALGYNFNAMTCESCKAFFRRNALSTKGFTCPFSEICEITVVTRRFCQKCRLDKCFQVGMKKEYIMSEEDKALKRKKIEQNRAKKRKVTETGTGGNTAQDETTDSELPTKIKREGTDSDSWSNSPSDYASAEIMHQTASSMQNLTVSNMNGYNGVPLSNDACNSSTAINDTIQTQTHVGESSSMTSTSQPAQSFDTSNHYSEVPQSMALTVESSPEEIVNRIVSFPTQASQTIASLMKTPKDAVFIMSKIINSQSDALKLISHFITAPGDALQIISKIMNSPLDALTVFAQFMSSPTDALQIIGKIISSPADVLQFMQQLMNQPEDAVQIMNKFMSSPAEALHMINKMMNHSEVVETIKEAADTSHFDENDQLDVVPPSGVSHSNTTSGASPSSTSFCEPTFGLLDSFFHSSPLPPPLSNECAPQNSDLSLFEDIERGPILPNTLQSILVQAIRLEYEGFNVGSLGGSVASSTAPTVPSVPQHQQLHQQQQQQSHQQQTGMSNSIELNDAERAKLNELIVANKALYAPVDEDLATLISEDCRMKVS